MPRFHPILIAALGAAFCPLTAIGQMASKAQVDTVSSVAECLAVGLPQEWKQLRVVIELPKPLAEAGAVRYQVTLPDDSLQPFAPCDPRLPPIKLVGLREAQEEKERGWTMLILTMKPDASFDLKYEYPKPPAKK
jgi:hypothetical protein